jgi:hypothetical protein
MQERSKHASSSAIHKAYNVRVQHVAGSVQLTLNQLGMRHIRCDASNMQCATCNMQHLTCNTIALYGHVPLNPSNLQHPTNL